MSRDPRRELSLTEIEELFHHDAATWPLGDPSNTVAWSTGECPHCGYTAPTLDTRGIEIFEGMPINCGRCLRHAFTVVPDGIVTVVP